MSEPATKPPDALPDDEVDFVCPADGAWFLVGPGDTATCPKCGAAGRMMTADEMDARVEEARREGTVDSDELRRRLGL